MQSALSNDANDVSRLRKIAKLLEEGQQRIGKRLSKDEVKAGLDALFGDGGVEGALAAMERVFQGGGKNEVTQLLENYPELTGSTRDKLLSTIQDLKLSRLVNELYRPNATVGDGGTAYILINEFYSGKSKHLMKARQRLKELDRLINSKRLGLNDLDIAEALRDDLEIAVNLFN